MYDDIFLFIKLVDIGNYSNAARLLEIYQSTLSRRIQNLENKLGVRLLNRNTYKISLTDAGCDLYNRFKPYQPILAQDLANILSSDTLSGNIKVAMDPVIADQLIIPYLDKFTNKFPNVEIHISIRSARFNLVKKGIDLAVGLRELEPAESIAVRILKKFQIKLFATISYKNKYGLPNTLNDLSQHKLINGAINQQSNNFIVRHIPTQEDIFVYINSLIRHDNIYESLKIAEESNEFIFSAPDFIVQEKLTAGTLVEVLPEYIWRELPCYLTQNLISQNKITIEFAKFIEQCICYP